MNYKRWHAAVVLGIGVGLAAASATAEDATFRDLARKYFKDGDGGDLAKLVGYSQPVKQVIALEYKVLLFADGKETAVDPKTFNFRIGDKVRVEIAPLSDYYVYIFHIGASGKKEFLLPKENEQPPMAKAGVVAGTCRATDSIEFAEPPEASKRPCWSWRAGEASYRSRSVGGPVLTEEAGRVRHAPEEEAVRKTIKATTSARPPPKSAREQEDRRSLDKTVMYRGLTSDAAMKNLVDDVHSRGVSEGTIEEPPHGAKTGTCALFVSMTKQSDARLLVTIPLEVEGEVIVRPSARPPDSSGMDM